MLNLYKKRKKVFIRYFNLNILFSLHFTQFAKAE